MREPEGSTFPLYFLTSLTLITMALFLSCSAPTPKLTGPAYDYDAAKDMFKKNRFEKATDFSDGLATASPPNDFTTRARVLRVVIFSGQLDAFRLLVDAYGKGADKTKNTHFKAEYERQLHDNLQYAGRVALALAETAHQITGGGSFPKELTLEVPYPTTEGPIEIPSLMKVQEGAWVEPDEQESAAIAAVNKGIDDALAAVVGGDRPKAVSALSAGPVKLNGVDFAVYLSKELLEGARMYDRKHGRDPQRLRMVCAETDEITKSALALLKESPNKDKEKSLKKIQDDTKTTLKNL
jgi:hypothetical protein